MKCWPPLAPMGSPDWLRSYHVHPLSRDPSRCRPVQGGTVVPSFRIHTSQGLPGLEHVEIPFGVRPVLPILDEHDLPAAACGEALRLRTARLLTGSAMPASFSSVRSAITWHTVAMLFARCASTSSSDGRAPRSRGTLGSSAHVFPSHRTTRRSMHFSKRLAGARARGHERSWRPR